MHHPQGTGSGTWQKSIEIWNMMRGKLIQSSEHPLTISESTASVNQVAEKISHEAFGDRQVKLLNSKNLPIPDVEGTRGTKYYKL